MHFYNTLTALHLYTVKETSIEILHVTIDFTTSEKENRSI